MSHYSFHYSEFALGLFQRRLLRVGELGVESIALLLGLGTPNEIVIKELLQYVEEPLGLAHFHFDDRSGICALDGMRSKIAHVSNRIDVICDVGEQLLRGEDLGGEDLI